VLTHTTEVAVNENAQLNVMLQFPIETKHGLVPETAQRKEEEQND